MSRFTSLGPQPGLQEHLPLMPFQLIGPISMVTFPSVCLTYKMLSFHLEMSTDIPKLLRPGGDLLLNCQEAWVRFFIRSGLTEESTTIHMLPAWFSWWNLCMERNLDPWWHNLSSLLIYLSFL